MQTSKIMDELLKATGIKAPKDPNDQQFLTKLWKAVDGLADADWDKIGNKAQAWSNAAATAVKKEEDIKPFPDLSDPEGGDQTEAEGDDQVAKKAAKKAPAKAAPAKKAAPAPAKKAAAAPAKKAAAKNGDKPKKSMLRAVREMICKKPELTTEQLVKKLEDAGYDASATTIGTIRSDTRNTLKIAQELGIVLKDLDFDA